MTDGIAILSAILYQVRSRFGCIPSVRPYHRLQSYVYISIYVCMHVCTSYDIPRILFPLCIYILHLYTATHCTASIYCHTLHCIYILPHTALHLYTATYCTAECATHPHCSVRQYLDTYIDQTHFDGKTLIFGVCRLLESNVYSCILLHGPCSTAWSMHAVEYTSTHYLRDVNTRVHMTCEM